MISPSVQFVVLYLQSAILLPNLKNNQIYRATLVDSYTSALALSVFQLLPSSLQGSLEAEVQESTSEGVCLFGLVRSKVRITSYTDFGAK